MIYIVIARLINNLHDDGLYTGLINAPNKESALDAAKNQIERLFQKSHCSSCEVIKAPQNAELMDGIPELSIFNEAVMFLARDTHHAD